MIEPNKSDSVLLEGDELLKTADEIQSNSNGTTIVSPLLPPPEVKALKSNEKYEPESSRPSKNYKKGSEGFPFSSEQLLNHIRENIDKITNDESKPEKVFYSKVRGVYLYGSRVFNTNVNDSDFDLLFIADDLHSTNSPDGGYARNTQYNLHSEITISDSNGETLSYDLEVMMMNTSVLLGYSQIHLPVILLSVQQPYDKFVVFEDNKMKTWRENWNRWFLRLPRSRNSILHELNFSFNKAHRFWVGLEKGQYTTEKEKKDALKKVKKNLAHGIRFCKYGYQIAFGGCIYDYLETNELYDIVVYGTDNYKTWDEYETLVKPLYDRWMFEYKEDIKAVMRESRKECLAMEKVSHGLTVTDFLNKFIPTFSKESTFLKRDYENITLSFGPFSLHRVFAINVTPVFMEGENLLNPNECSLFQLDIDYVFQESENSLSFREMDLFLECHGTIIEVSQNDNKVQYYPICVPRFFSEEFEYLDKRFGEGYSKKLNLSDFSVFENPSGTRINLYFYKNEWQFSFGNECQRWQKEWIMDKDYTNELANEFIKIWEKLDMKKPIEQHYNFTFFFTYQQQERIIYCGCRNLKNMKEEVLWRDLGDQYNWKDQAKQVFFNSVEEIKDAINDFNQYPPLSFEGFECINFKNNYRSFQIKSDLRSSAPHLRITNTNYVGYLLDEDIISNPPTDLIDSKHNYDTLICIIVNSKFSETDKGDEQVLSDLNRIFLKPYLKLKYSYTSLVKTINDFYSNTLLNFEDQPSDFQERSKLFMEGKVKKSCQFFTSYLRFRKKTNLTDISLYWKSLSTKRDNAGDLRFIKQLIEINK